MATTTSLATPALTTHASSAQSPATSKASTIKSLDGVRGFAILLVLWCHYDEFLRGPTGNNALSGAVRFLAWNASGGVTLFFTLSGFLLFLPYARSLVDPAHAAWPRPLTFYQRRVRRILPAYLTVFVAIVALTLVQLARQHQPLTHLPWQDLIPGLFLLYDIRSTTFNLIIGNNLFPGVFDPPLWSLTVEWQFYLALPLIAWVLSRLGSLRRVVLALILLIVYGLAVHGAVVLLHYAGHIDSPIDAPGLLGIACGLFHGYNGKFLEVFALGMLASLFYVWAVEQQRWTPAQQRRLGLVLLPAAVLGFFFCTLWWAFTVAGYLGHWPAVSPSNLPAMAWMIAGTVVIGFCSTALILAVLCLPHSWGKVFSFAPLTFCGLISYSLYLWHWPIAKFDLAAGAWLPPIAVLGLAFAWSTILYYLVERPFLRYRHQQQAQTQTLRN